MNEIKCQQEGRRVTSASVSSAELMSALRDGERLVMLPQSSTTVTNVCETVHVPYVNDSVCLNLASPSVLSHC